MKVVRFARIRGYRNFVDFEWPPSLADFGRFNLIYGWNAAGKTTISSLFAHLQSRTPIPDGQVEFQIDDRLVSGTALATAPLPEVRVFNRDYIAISVLERISDLSPIYHFGEESVETQHQLEERRLVLATAESQLVQVERERNQAAKTLDDLCVRQAQAIKMLVNTPGKSRYNYYNKADFTQTARRLASDRSLAPALSEAQKAELRQQKDASAKASLAFLSVPCPDFSQVASDAASALSLSVQSRALAELVAEPAVGQWVERGLELHTGTHSTGLCRFCGNPLAKARLESIEEHFDDHFRRFQTDLAARISNIDRQVELMVVDAPDSMRLYEDLAPGYDLARPLLMERVECARVWLAGVRGALSAKAKSPFESFDLAAFVDVETVPTNRAIAEALKGVNDVIAAHNARSADFRTQTESAQAALELALVADVVDDFASKAQASEESAAAASTSKDEALRLREEVGALESGARKHGLMGDELNADLEAYLGRSDLILKVREAGYSLVRGGSEATNLSEGEKTAIAFLYFLKSLRDTSFRMDRGVVVIDDPVSSLDANSLFSAFGYMKERTEKAGQLFVLTHNFSFFAQVKNWFTHLPKGTPAARFYLVQSRDSDGVRCGSLEVLDPLLRNYQSEYHFLFKKVYEEAHKTGVWAGLESCYEAPNLARRLLESFLSFRYPGEAGHVEMQLEHVKFPIARKARVLRLLHFGSHSTHIAEPEHDLSVLSETRQVLGDLLELMKAADGPHFAEMEKLVAAPLDPIAAGQTQ